MRAKLLHAVTMVLLAFSPSASRADGSLAPLDRRLVVMALQGFGASTQFPREDYQALRSKDFSDQIVSFRTSIGYEAGNIQDPPGFLAAIKNSDVFFYSGHSGRRRADPTVQVLEAREGNEPAFVRAPEIAEALKSLQNRTGPRLVIINGCETTNPADGVISQNRLSTAFGITDETVGRAYLGWDELVVGLLADDRIGELLTAWVKPDATGRYMTIEEARLKVGIQNLRVIGDHSLRYKDSYRLMDEKAMDKSNAGARFLWDVTGAKTARLSVYLDAKQKANLQQFGVSGGRLDFTATRERGGQPWFIRDETFENLVKAVVGVLVLAPENVMGKSNATAEVELLEGTGIYLTPDNDKLRVSIRVPAWVTIKTPGQQDKAKDVNKDHPFNFIGVPERD